jgi:hypothetical protein
LELRPKNAKMVQCEVQDLFKKYKIYEWYYGIGYYFRT